MGCFIVPAAEAVVTTVVKKKLDADGNHKNPFAQRIGWLNNMLWGGSALLAFEHVWHGEVTPWFPFLTRAANPAEAVEMLQEMAVSGVGMAVLVTAVWAAVVAVTRSMQKNPVGSADAVRVPVERGRKQ